MNRKNKAVERTETGNVPNIATIMFIDIVGCSTISNVLGVEEYGSFLGDFKKIVEWRIDAVLRDNYRTKTGHRRRQTIPKYLRYDVRGDEACVILFSDYVETGFKEKDLARTNDANTAIEIAVKIKQDWLGCDYNKEQLGDGKLPCDLGIGINSGPVHIKVEKKEPLPEGYAINLAKRIEGESRRCKYSGILVGQLTKSFYDNNYGESEAFFNEVEMVSLKGILQPVPTYEIKYYTLPTALELLSRRSPWLTETINEDKRRAKNLLPHTRRAWEANRSSAWLTNVYGNQCLQTNRYEDAEGTFVELRKAHPKDAEPHCLLGNVYGEQGEYEDEKKCYERAIRLNPYVPEWHYYLGLCLSYILAKKERKLGEDKRNKEIKKILDCFDEAIYLSRRFSWAYYDKACVLNHYRRKKQAQKELNEARKMDPECKEAAISEPYLEGLHGGPPMD